MSLLPKSRARVSIDRGCEQYCPVTIRHSVDLAKLRMSATNHEAEPSLLETVDFRAFLETLKLRWWIIPLVVAISVGFLKAQESDLRVKPATFFVSRSFEFGSPLKPLTAVGIELPVVEFPDPASQLILLKSTETRQTISKELGKDIEVQLPTDWTMPVTFSCNQPLLSDCESAIEAYVNKALEIRRSAISTGITNLRSQLVLLKDTDPAGTANRIAALDAVAKDLTIPRTLVDGFEQAIGPTLDDDRPLTYQVGIASGLLISLLVLLQLTLTDSRVRSVRQLIRIVGRDAYLGTISTRSRAVRDRRSAIALLHGTHRSGSLSVRYVPTRNAFAKNEILARLSEMSNVPHTVARPFAELSVPELIAPTESQADVIVVSRNRDLRKDVHEVFAALSRSQRPLAGVLLVD